MSNDASDSDSASSDSGSDNSDSSDSEEDEGEGEGGWGEQPLQSEVFCEHSSYFNYCYLTMISGICLLRR